MHAAVRDEEIIVRPFLEAIIIGWIMKRTSGTKCRVKFGGILLIGNRRVEIRTTPEPCCLRCKESRVHMDSGHMRIGHMRDKADPGCGETRIFCTRAIDGRGKFGRETAAYGRYVDPDFLEHLALHQALHTAAGR